MSDNVAAQGEHDPRIVHVASELVVDLGPQAENEGNVEFVTDVIAAVDYANEQCGLTYEQGRADELHRLICGEDVMPSDCACLAEGYARGRADERETFDQQALFADAKAWGYAAGLDAARDAVGAELDSYRADCINDNKIISLIAVDTFRHTMRTIAAARGEQQWVR